MADQINELEIALEAGYQHGQADAAAELSRLQAEIAEAREIMLAVLADNAQAMPLGLADCIDNTGEPYQSQSFADLMTRARAFLKEKADG